MIKTEESYLDLDLIYINELNRSSDDGDEEGNSDDESNLNQIKKLNVLPNKLRSIEFNDNKKYSLPTNINQEINSEKINAEKKNSLPLSKLGHNIDKMKKVKKSEDKGLIAKNKLWKSNVMSFSKEDIMSISTNDNLIKILEDIVEKEKKKKIDSIYLNDNKLERIDEKDLEIMAGVCFKKKIRRLVMSNNLINSFDATPTLQHLKKLDLSNNSLTELPSSIEILSKIEILLLGKNKLKDITALSSLIYLVTLDVSENLIGSLSKKLMSCLCLKKVNLSTNPIINPPYEVCSKGWKFVIQYWKSQEKNPHNLKSNETRRKKITSIIRQESYTDEDLNKEAILTVLLSSKEGTEQLGLYLKSVYAEENLKFLEKVKEYDKSFFVHKIAINRKVEKILSKQKLHESAPSVNNKIEKKKNKKESVSQEFPMDDLKSRKISQSLFSSDEVSPSRSKKDELVKLKNRGSVGLVPDQPILYFDGLDEEITKTPLDEKKVSKKEKKREPLKINHLITKTPSRKSHSLDENNEDKYELDFNVSKSHIVTSNRKMSDNHAGSLRKLSTIGENEDDEVEEDFSSVLSTSRKKSVGNISPRSKCQKQQLNLKAIETAEHIYKEFIDVNSEQNVNLPFDLVLEIENALKQKRYTPDLFTKANKHIFSVLAVDKVIPFKKSPFYQVYKNNQKNHIFEAIHTRKRFSYNKEGSCEKVKGSSPPRNSPRHSHPPSSAPVSVNNSPQSISSKIQHLDD